MNADAFSSTNYSTIRHLQEIIYTAVVGMGIYVENIVLPCCTPDLASY